MNDGVHTRLTVVIIRMDRPHADALSRAWEVGVRLVFKVSLTP